MTKYISFSFVTNHNYFSSTMGMQPFNIEINYK